jgi:hypothetical protein
MLVQIGFHGLNPDHIVNVLLLDTWVKVYTTISHVDPHTGESSNILTFTGEDCDAFMDWWNRCAGVAKFPNGNGKLHVQVEVTGGVAEVTQCPPNVKVSILDWDNLENGGCPYCGSENIDDDPDAVQAVCYDCGKTWEE